MRERGVVDARRGDVVALQETVEPDRFQSALVIGTQLGLAGSMAGVRQFIDDLAVVTASNATAVVDGYDPTCEGVEALFGFRDDPTPGLVHRGYHVEYEGEVGETFLFRLCSPGRLRAAATETGWTIDEVRYDPTSEVGYYRAALSKACCWKPSPNSGRVTSPRAQPNGAIEPRESAVHALPRCARADRRANTGGRHATVGPFVNRPATRRRRAGERSAACSE